MGQRELERGEGGEGEGEAEKKHTLNKQIVVNIVANATVAVDHYTRYDTRYAVHVTKPQFIHKNAKELNRKRRH